MKEPFSLYLHLLSTIWDTEPDDELYGIFILSVVPSFLKRGYAAFSISVQSDQDRLHRVSDSYSYVAVPYELHINILWFINLKVKYTVRKEV